MALSKHKQTKTVLYSELYFIFEFQDFNKVQTISFVNALFIPTQSKPFLEIELTIAFQTLCLERRLTLRTISEICFSWFWISEKMIYLNLIRYPLAVHVFPDVIWRVS